MRLSAVTQARFVAVIEIFDLDPRGRLYYPGVFSAFAKRFNFQKFPQKYEDFDQQKGIEFFQGQWEGGPIEKLSIFGGGFSVDTRSSTEDSENFLEHCLLWAASEYGIQYQSGMIKRKAYVSNVTFHSDAPILVAMSRPLAKLSERVTTAVGQILGEKIDYQPSVFWIHYDQLTRKMPIAGFTVQRRVEAPFSENKYYSEAPLPTDVHLTLLQEFEADVLSSAR
jgi:hypothetical protein